MLRGALAGAYRPSVLGRQPTTITTTSPLRRLASQAWRQATSNATTPTSIPSRGIRWSSNTGRTLVNGSPVLRSSQGWRNTSTAQTAQRLLSRTQKRNFNWSRPRRSDKSSNGGSTGSKGGSEDANPQSLSARLRKLSREYGWAAVGVYLGLSVLDFPFCFLLVRLVGTDRIAAVEHWFMGHVKAMIPDGAKEWWHEYSQAFRKAEKEELGSNDISDDMEKASWGVEEAEERNKQEASLATQLALAYAIHKTFIFVRVPLTAAVTPKVVKVLRSWGWQIGKRKSKR
ncbi:N-terminal acetyltransferase 2 [Cytospora mali]|uniref:N-terminal acetyltransferase 2 n=1 Tax=Cytospora mali TaxID=578113 RepID=A0A194VGK1_CYTMA|nr:N-terminal acetyltransferase 2 [Valsa mali var. pyri (nom. inval.)]